MFVCHSVLSVLCCCWERTDLLALLYVIFKLSCVFAALPHGVLHWVYLFVLIPEFYLLPYFIDHSVIYGH